MTQTISPAANAGQEVAPDAPARETDPAASPPTHRVVQVMELLSRRATEHLSLARIVRETGLSRATAHAVVTQLTADGWLVRDEDGCYGLGFGLLALARRAEAAFPLRRTAQAALRALSATVGVPVFLAERDGEAIVVTEVLGTPSAGWIRVGRRLPLAPPVCREFVAWAPEAERTAWLDRADPAHRDRLAAVLDAVAARGYSVERLVDDSTPMLEALSALRSSTVTDPLRHHLGAVIAELVTIDYLPDEVGAVNAVVTVAVPVFGPDGRVAASVVACPDARLTATELTELAATITAAADRIAGELRGEAAR
ncbi:helix-turn-helix domain-containing protein [Nocardia thailandica]|uniref:helix-turn-helix domain-containing protein n=1 Tax=Nocardia thailandica TaxID=257275 RepID=UPI0005B91C04|nr:helix-turn-helix domain-containing protein [Nocardia thailandica]